MLDDLATWGIASFDNDTASDWFFAVEESLDPGAVMTDAIDEAISTVDQLESSAVRQSPPRSSAPAVPARGRPRLPDHIECWVELNHHRPARDEVAHAVQAVRRIRDDSELRQEWDDPADEPNAGWLTSVDDLLARLERSH